MSRARAGAAAGAAAALVALAAAVGPANAARPAYRIAEGALPGNVERARAILRRELARAHPDSTTRRDIAYVLRLGQRLTSARNPAGRRATVNLTLRVNAWWYARRQAPRKRVILRHPDGLLSTHWAGRGFAVNPVATAGRWQKLNVSVPPAALAEALLPLGVARRAGATRFLLWEYYDVPDQPGRIAPGASGMAQGRVAQLMARAYHKTGERRFADAARGALNAFTVSVRRGGVTSRVAEPGGAPRMPWYVERAYPGANPWKGAALNGFMVTLLNLHAAAPLLGARPERVPRGTIQGTAHGGRAVGSRAAAQEARDLFAAGTETLVRYLPLHDTGRWSLYGLLTPGRPWRSYLADEGYHCYHVELLRQLDEVAPRRGFGDVAVRWSDYALSVGVNCELGLLPPPSAPPAGSLADPGTVG